MLHAVDNFIVNLAEPKNMFKRNDETERAFRSRFPNKIRLSDGESRVLRHVSRGRSVFCPQPIKTLRFSEIVGIFQQTQTLRGLTRVKYRFYVLIGYGIRYLTEEVQEAVVRKSYGVGVIVMFPVRSSQSPFE